MRADIESPKRPPAPETKLILVVCAILFVIGVALIESAYLTPQASTTGSTGAQSTSSVASLPTAEVPTVETIPLGSAPYGSSFDPVSGDAFVAVSNADSVAVLDSQGHVLNEIPTGGPADFLAYNAANGLLYTALVGNNSVALINTTSGEVVSHISVPTSSGWMAYDPASRTVYSVDREANSVYVISGTTVTKTISLTGLPFAVAYDPSDGDMYVTNNDGAVFIINGTSGDLLNTLQLGGPSSNLLGVAFDPHDQSMYVTSYTDGTVIVVNGSTIVRSLGGFNDPIGIASDAAGSTVYVVNSGNATVTEVSASGSSNVPVGNDPREVVYDSAVGGALVTNYGNSTVSLLRP